jgi:hypothetical protein
MSLAVQSLCILGKSFIDASDKCSEDIYLQQRWDDYVNTLSSVPSASSALNLEIDELPEEELDVPATLMRMTTMDIKDAATDVSVLVGNINETLQMINETGGDRYSKLAEHTFSVASVLDAVAPESS